MKHGLHRRRQAIRKIQRAVRQKRAGRSRHRLRLHLRLLRLRFRLRLRLPPPLQNRIRHPTRVMLWLTTAWMLSVDAVSGRLALSAPGGMLPSTLTSIDSLLLSRCCYSVLPFERVHSLTLLQLL